MSLSEQFPHIVRENEPLAPYTWLQLGGPARFFAEPNSPEEFAAVVKQAKADGLTVRMLGDGSNVLVRESGVDGVVIRLATAGLCDISISEQTVRAAAGAKLNHVISAAVAAGLTGLEHLAGIPGTIGAAVSTNAGVKNGDIGSRVTKITCVGEDGELQQLTRDELRFGFRRSSLDGSIVVEVELTLTEGEPSELTRRMQSSWIVRRADQPPSGSRTTQALIEPDGTDLAHLLAEAGLKDEREGNVVLSSQHPGFVLITAEATSEQVLALLARVQQTVEARTGTQLQSQLKIW